MVLNDLMVLLKTEKGQNDRHAFGKVETVNEDGTYEVELGTESTVTCGKITGAEVGDTVLVLTLANGHSVVIGTIGGDKDVLALVNGLAKVAGEALNNKTRIDNLAQRVQALEDRL